MPPGKAISSTDEAVADIPDCATIMVGGYAVPGTPQHLVKALLKQGIGSLVCISGPWYWKDRNLYDMARLVASGRVKRLITTAPIYSYAEDGAPQKWSDGQLELEIVAQGTLAERIWAGGAGLGGTFLPTPMDTAVEDGREKLVIDGQEYILEEPLKADFALLRAHKADTLGNLVYHNSQRNWNPIMAMAAEVTIVEVDQIVQPGDLDPELVITPGIYVNRIVEVGGGSL